MFMMLVNEFVLVWVFCVGCVELVVVWGVRC